MLSTSRESSFCERVLRCLVDHSVVIGPLSARLHEAFCRWQFLLTSFRSRRRPLVMVFLLVLSSVGVVFFWTFDEKWWLRLGFPICVCGLVRISTSASQFSGLGDATLVPVTCKRSCFCVVSNTFSSNAPEQGHFGGCLAWW